MYKHKTVAILDISIFVAFWRIGFKTPYFIKKLLLPHLNLTQSLCYLNINFVLSSNVAIKCFYKHYIW